MKRLKILQVTNRLPWPLNDGGNLATYNVTRELNALGHEVILASLNTLKHRQDPQQLAHVADVRTFDLDTNLSPWGLFRGLFQKMPYNVARFDSEGFKSLLKQIVRDEKPDLVQMEGSYQALFVPAVREAGDMPVVLRSHNVEWQVWERLYQNEKNPLKRFYLGNLYWKIKRFEEETLGRFDGVIAITTEDEAWYREQGYRGELVAINAGAEMGPLEVEGEWAPMHKVGFIGSMEWQPNVQGVKWFVDSVWPQVLARVPNAELHLAGKHPPTWMEQWQVPGMHFHGMVPDAGEFLKGFRIFIVPLLSGGGMRLKIVEALAQKKCVLSTPVGAEGILVEPEKDLLLAEKPGDFADSLVRLLQDDELTRRLATNGQETIRKHYDWKQLIRRFEDFYQRFQ